MSVRRLAALTTAGFLFTACAHVPPEELVAARQAYKTAAAGPAAVLVPAELHKADVALQEAESEFADHPKSYHAADLAYVAQRKAQLAGALAVVAGAEADAEKSKAAYDALQTHLLDTSQSNLAASQSALATSATNLSAAEQATRDANARTDAANAELAAAKEDARGLVITLSGSVLFRTDESVLMPEAQTRLDQVVAALLTKPDRQLTIEGHTDSRGDDAHNTALSLERATAVRSYIVTHGYKSSLVTAVGMGESKPVADNTTPEGMANNRRVEIVIKNVAAR